MYFQIKPIFLALRKITLLVHLYLCAYVRDIRENTILTETSIGNKIGAITAGIFSFRSIAAKFPKRFTFTYFFFINPEVKYSRSQ